MIVQLGSDAGPLIADQMDGARASQLRLLLTIMAKLGTPAGFDLAAYARHADSAVRREALRSLIRDPRTRDEAIPVALGDADERIVRLALGAAMTNCPPPAARALIARANDPTWSPDLRALGVRAASSCRQPDVLAFLLSRVGGKRRFLRREALAPPTPEMLAALSGLAAHWAHEPDARRLLDVAAHSADKDVRDAAIRRAVAT
jgi:hypothetical protein